MLFQITTPTVSRILTKLGTHVLFSNMHKTVEQIYEILLLNFLANF